MPRLSSVIDINSIHLANKQNDKKGHLQLQLNFNLIIKNYFFLFYRGSNKKIP